MCYRCDEFSYYIHTHVLYIFQGIHVPQMMNYSNIINLFTLSQFKLDKIWILRKVIAQHNFAKYHLKFQQVLGKKKTAISFFQNIFIQVILPV